MYSPTRTLSCCLRSVVLSGLAFALASGALAGVGSGKRQPVSEGHLGIQIPFVPNTGLNDPDVAFRAATFAGTTFITRDGSIVYSLRAGAKNTSGWTLTETAVHARVLRPVEGEGSGTRVSLFLGDDPTRWRSGVETYRTVSLGKAWPGVSLALRAYGNAVEKLFTVEPGADASLIRMHIDGAKSLRLARDGSLLLSTGVGDVRFTPPIAYQEHAAGQRGVSIRYRVAGSGYGFVLGNYDRSVPLVIDPVLQATYLGGSSGDQTPNALAVHPTSGEIYLAGVTNSANFPGTAGGAQPIYAFEDAFVARLNPSLTALAQATYLGGSKIESAHALVIHPFSGDVYIAGTTNSPDFPGTAGGAQSGFAGTSDAFVARLNGSLTTLHQATYLGGSGPETALALGVHPMSREVYAAGTTGSANFPGTAGGAQPTGGAPRDAFLARLNASLTALSQATYLGGSDFEAAFGLAVHPISGEAYVVGHTTSTDFPTTAGGVDPTLSGSEDGFVARLNPSLTALVQATYLGGSSLDSARALALHPTSGEVYVAGGTISTDFPGTDGGAQPGLVGDGDAFLARLDATLTTLSQATYLGGSSVENAYGLTIHPASHEVYVAGVTSSTDLPGTAGGAQPNFGGVTDTFVARLTADLAGGPAPTPTPLPAPAVAVPTLSAEMFLLLFVALGSAALLLLKRTL